MTGDPNKQRRRARIWPSIQGDANERASFAMARLEDITRLVAEWVWEVDPEGRITFISERVTQDLGFLPIEIVGRKFTEIGRFGEPSDDGGGERAAPDWRSPFREQLYTIRGKDESLRRVLMSGVPVYDPRTWEFLGACGAARDISKLSKSEENQAYLENANRMLVEASEAKSAFLAKMSHELRTPLNAIIGFSEVMSERLFGPVGDERYVEYAKDIHQSAEHLLSLVNDILDLSRIEAGRFELYEETIEIGAAVNTCINMIRPLAEAEGLNLKMEVASDLPPVCADDRALQQILLNLLSNAVKFTPEGGDVGVNADLSQDGGVMVQVWDTGIGIAEDNRTKVLEPFATRRPDLAVKGHGVGLGLTITKALVEKHGGSFELESEAGKGTRVCIHFPPERSLSRPDYAPAAS